MTNVVDTLLLHAGRLSAPPAWDKAEQGIVADRIMLEALLASPNPPRMYGGNVRVGHQDDTVVSSDEMRDFQIHLVQNHSFAPDEPYPDWVARCIGYCKVNAIAQGGTGVSLDLYQLVRRAVTDPAFRPKVPQNASYSAGDVIPGAHWARYLIEHYGYELRPKEALALMQGTFVQQGVALSLVPEIYGVVQAWLAAGQAAAVTAVANPGSYMADALTANASDPLRGYASMVYHLLGKFENHDKQDPISLKAFPQAAAALNVAVQAYIAALETSLLRRNDNPLVLSGIGAPIGTAAYMAFEIPLAAHGLLSALRLAGWMSVSRLQHILSGHVPGVPRDGINSTDGLGFIQFPKYAMSQLEAMRMLGGTPFTTGASTSYGIEDVWSHGLIALSALEKGIKHFAAIVAVELLVVGYVNAELAKPRIYLDAVGWLIANNNMSMAQRLAGLQKEVKAGKVSPHLPKERTP